MDDKPLRPMYPIRHQPRLWSIDIGSISLKDAQQQMEFPFFSLSKNPDLKPRRYEDRLGNTLEITAHSTGLPTIYDKDFLIYAISLVMDCLNCGEQASRRIVMHATDMLEFANRRKGGRDYQAIEDALVRLSGCRIKTNIRTGDTVQTDIFGLIDRGSMVRKYGFNGRLQRVEVTLSEWLWNAIQARQVLTLHPDYFRLRQPLERRIYEIARKFCGRQPEWRVRLILLHHRCGAKSKLFEFRRAVRKLIASGDLLDYEVSHDAASDMVTFRRREGALIASSASLYSPADFTLPASVAAEARRRHGDGIDLQAAERDWHQWMAKKSIRPASPPAMFLSFLDSWANRHEILVAPSADDEQDWIAEMALEWWASLRDAEREFWRSQVGERIELSDGEGWFRSEASMAGEAFDRRWRQQLGPVEWMELPPQLLARAALAAGPDVGTGEIEAGWREWIVDIDWLHDRPLWSVMSYAERLAKRSG